MGNFFVAPIRQTGNLAGRWCGDGKGQKNKTN